MKNNMKFVVITKSDLRFIPPVISVSYILKDLGHNVHVITSGASDSIIEQMRQRNITMDIYPYATATHILGKIWEYLRFRKLVKQRLEELSFDYLLIEGATTIRSLGSFIKKYLYILQISELHDNSRAQLKTIGKVIHQAKLVFMPEYNRTVFYQVWFHLKKRPITLPNKPYFIPSQEELGSLKDKYKELLTIFKSYKVILYQGMFFEERDLSNFIRAIKELGGEYKLVLLGKGMDMLRRYKEIDNTLVHIEFIPAPDYLVFTSMCYLGIVTYDLRSLNTAYCAPNKIFEYAAFGKPIIANNIPGLKLIGDLHAGEIVDENNVLSIKKAILQIEKNYTSYYSGALDCFNSIDNNNTIKQSLKLLD